jgi:hypothetical protein
MPLTIPLTFGFHEVTVYGFVALKLNTLFRAYVVPFQLIAVNVPTAYIVLPHCASFRTCSVVPVFDSWGVPEAGVADTGPVAAPAGAAVQIMLAASAAAPATAPARHLLRHIESPHARSPPTHVAEVNN